MKIKVIASAIARKIKLGFTALICLWVVLGPTTAMVLAAPLSDTEQEALQNWSQWVPCSDTSGTSGTSGGSGAASGTPTGGGYSFTSPQQGWIDTDVNWGPMVGGGDASKTSFVALSSEEAAKTNPNMQPGDIIVLTYKGKVAYAIYGDSAASRSASGYVHGFGDGTQYLEVSPHVATTLTGKVDNLPPGVQVTLYPGTAHLMGSSNADQRDQAKIDIAGAQVSGAGSVSGTGGTPTGSSSSSGGSSSSAGNTCCGSGAAPAVSAAPPVASGTLVWPFATKASSQYNRVDQGWDIQDKAGAAVYAIAPGTLNVFNPDPGNFGNDYPVEKLDSSIGGPSDWVYYGHVHIDAGLSGKHVNAGDLIAHANVHDGDNGSGAPPGWLEIGFAQAGTDAPVDSGSGPTAGGAKMKQLLLNAKPNPAGAGATPSSATPAASSSTSSATATTCCPTAADGSGGGPANVPPGSGSPSQNEKVIYGWLTGTGPSQPGLSPAGAAGVLGNMSQENGFSTADNSGGMGIVQWTGSRRTSEIALAQKDNLQPTDLQAQLNYLYAEMTCSPAAAECDKAAYDAVKKATDPVKAADDWEALFERAGTPVMANRESAARDALAKYGSSNGSGPVSTTGSTSSSGSSPTCCPSGGGTGVLPGGTLVMMDNTSNVPPPGGATVAAGYLNGHGQSRAWTSSDWSQAKSQYKYLLTIYVAYSSFATAKQDADDAVKQSKAIGITPGSAIALDIEAVVAGQAGSYTVAWANQIKADGYTPMVYTSQSTASVIPKGVLDWLAYTSSGKVLDGHAAHQYDFSGTYDLSVVDGTKVPLSPSQGGSSGSSTSSGAGSSSAGCSSTPGTYQNPFRDIKNLVPERIDEGVDYGGDGNVYAIGNATVTFVGSGWFGSYGPSVVYKLKDGPAAGHSIFVSENVTPKVKQGDTVSSSTVVAIMHSARPTIETGWVLDGSPSPADEPAAGPDYAPKVPDGSRMAYGQNFSDLMKKLGAPPGNASQSTNPSVIVGKLAPGWPTW